MLFKQAPAGGDAVTLSYESAAAADAATAWPAGRGYAPARHVHTRTGR